MSKAGHRRFELYAHITWHTWRRRRCIRAADVDTVTRAILAAAGRTSIHILAQAIMADHVHVLVSFRPDRALTPFIREAKSEAARRVNAAEAAHLWWARGYFGGSVSHGHIATVRTYIARQRLRHPELIPSG